ncbi:uncharacterized protein CANTADRAFT_130740 [Suhomyces tanzawaensis NRRL Y-17324]|uniref:Uncharacterized protein n=1 Tax=Suhomyces tanzawaensis NRRL Y-17324 TaxID=984487 RepID=A0A1E4SR36_9ASCO|nr:uncharacterized protein CANTADRAFT_130740 [Suhomyces tanzawaensis NRRL Y-17324]ODV81958.1 hypothetical protein CANTADRAFT_130740 [Suhomyces tanzawaensis NRRL Y-17324]
MENSWTGQTFIIAPDVDCTCIEPKKCWNCVLMGVIIIHFSAVVTPSSRNNLCELSSIGAITTPDPVSAPVEAYKLWLSPRLNIVWN